MCVVTKQCTRTRSSHLGLQTSGGQLCNGYSIPGETDDQNQHLDAAYDDKARQYADLEREQSPWERILGVVPLSTAALSIGAFMMHRRRARLPATVIS